MNRRHFLGSTLTAAVAAAIPGAANAGSLLNALTTISSSLVAKTGAGDEVTIEEAALEELKGALRGNLLLADSEGYDKARRVLNPSIDRFPALIVQPSGATDVASAVTFAKEHDLLVAVKCGGHSFSGKSTCDGGMQIDLSLMRGAHVNRAAKTAHVAGGSLLGDLDHECMAQGLVTTAGTVSHTGVGGLSLGGGFGRLARKYGLTLDNIKSVDIVTADGVLRRASADENADLFWAVRGGGGNFGVVTNFEFGLHEMDRTVIAGDVVFPMERLREIMSFYADFSLAAPDELSLDFIAALPPGGEPGAVVIHAVWSGDHAAADKVLAPIAKLGEPVANTIGPMDYVALQRAWDDSDPRHGGDYLKSGFVADISAAQMDTIADGFEGHPDRGTTFFYQQSGGAINRVAEDATAFPNRNAENGAAVIVAWNEGVDRQPHVDYIRSYWSTIEKFTDGFYTNTGDYETQQATNSNYRGNYKRLVELKDKYDPGNLFRLNANVAPSKAS
ncbi:MAG: FAD-binding protein [Woeseiaceae bacterium]|nr:FAD-binding protein [Woeseiaceae bacterium]NIP20807.1 FAD-binding protein [Woeseiaceae bacterium]NIS89600.1 FAD-binding protein [Woeseiaceae bacterium]